MEMSIEEAINHLGNYSSTNGSGLTTDKQHNEAKRVAIDIMRKYQKIKEAVNNWHHDIEAKDFECMAEIADEVEDGNDD